MSPTTQTRPGAETSEYRFTKLTAAIVAVVGLLMLIADMILKAIGYANGLPGAQELGGSLLSVGLPLLGVGYAISRGLAKSGPKLLVLIAVVGLSGCSLATVNEAVKHAHTGVEATWTLGYIPISASCRARAMACKGRPGVATMPTKCTAWVECDKVRAKLTAGAKKASQGLVEIRDAAVKARAMGILKK